MRKAMDRRAGELDPDFGDHGIVAVAHSITRRPVEIDTATGLGDGRIVCAGRLDPVKSAVFRLLQNGRLDLQFGVSGFCELPRNPEVRFESGFLPQALHVQADGKMIVLGRIDVLIDRSPALVPAAARVTVDGHLDTSFGHQGLAIYVPPPVVAAGLRLDFSGLDAAARSKAAIRQAPDRSVVFISDVALPGGGGTLLVKIRHDGVLDESFGQGGFLTPRMDTTISVDIDREGRILVCADTNGIGYVTRYLPDGELDTTFGNGFPGQAFPPPPAYTRSWTAMDLCVLDDGSLFTVAFLAKRPVSSEPYKQMAGLYRLTANGQIDTEFNGGEAAVFDLLPDGYIPERLGIDADGRLLVTGIHVTAGGPVRWLTFAASRQFATGDLDPDFGDGGKVRLPSLQKPKASFVSGTKLVFVARTAREERSVVGRLLG